MLTLAAVLVLPLVGSSPVASAEANPRTHAWHLKEFDVTPRMCVQHNPGGWIQNSYFIFSVTGSWSTDLDFGMRDLPPGWTATGSHIPPGSNYPDPDDGGVRINGFIQVGGPVSTPIDVYEARIWVSDGTVTETVPAEIVITTASWVECMQSRE
ncbi:DUF5980 family protein [Saccharothrix xinjiangensis]|uniref:DUF5980 family protein n=1 Tax=Saccharothrix xinjiangensis TaxID=204798 RepID=A0ABV9Y4J6_9PSEU